MKRIGTKKAQGRAETDSLVNRLLDLGFTGSITRILQLLPKQRRTGLFSATMTDALSELVRVGLRNPVRVIVKVEAKKMAGIKRKSSEVVEERRTPARYGSLIHAIPLLTSNSLRNGFIHCHAEEKTQKLIGVLKHESTHSANKFIVYFATCATVEYFYRVCSTRPLLAMLIASLDLYPSSLSPIVRLFLPARPFTSRKTGSSSCQLYSIPANDWKVRCFAMHRCRSAGHRPTGCGCSHTVRLPYRYKDVQSSCGKDGANGPRRPSMGSSRRK